MATSKSKKIETKRKVKTQGAIKPIEQMPELQLVPSDEIKIKPREKSFDRGVLILGASLLIIGVLLLLGQFLRIPLADYLWPFIFIIPGVILFISAVNMQSGGSGLAIAGGILTALGGLFLFQSITGFWASWAYAWSLVAPTSIGLSQWIFGSIKKNDSLVTSGQQLMRVGLTIFAIGFTFFEIILSISGFGLEQFGLPVIPIALIAIGIFILIRALVVKK